MQWAQCARNICTSAHLHIHCPLLLQVSYGVVTADGATFYVDTKKVTPE